MGEYTQEQLDLNESKDVKALKKEIGEDGVKDFLSNTNDQLKAIISSGHMEIDEVDAKINANPDLIEAKEIVKDFAGSRRDALKPIKLRMKAAAAILRIRGVKK